MHPAHSVNDLGQFLQTRRARVSPELAGIPRASRRRVDGLRREEVAARAGVSVEYYIRLEQGRARNPSPGVVRALVTALNLDGTEERHLLDLVAAQSIGPVASVSRQEPTAPVRATIVGIVESMTDRAVMVYNHRMDVLAWNDLAAALFFDFGRMPSHQRNLARFGFLSARARERFVDWEAVEQGTVGQLRLAAARYPHDHALTQLITELCATSPLFNEWWNGRHVTLRTHGHKQFRHEACGELTLSFENFDLPSVVRDDQQRMIVFSASDAAAESGLVKVLEYHKTNQDEDPFGERIDLRAS